MKIKCSECGYIFEAEEIPRSCPDCGMGPLFAVVEHRFNEDQELNLPAMRVTVLRKITSGSGKPYYLVRNEPGSAKVPEQWLHEVLRF